MEQTILLVEDEAPLRRAYALALGRHGYRVIEAGNGEEALRILREERVALLLTDLVMPEKEGIETIVTVRRTHPMLPIVAMTGGGRHMPPALLLDSAARLGAHRTLSKPFPLDMLVMTVGELLATPTL